MTVFKIAIRRSFRGQIDPAPPKADQHEKQIPQIPPDLLEKYGQEVDPAEFAATVSKIMSVPADEIP